ncbi:MAG: hypothetical protein ABI210_14950 [Abditibacteriaceae bacterium]
MCEFTFDELLVPIFRKGKTVYTSPSLVDIQKNTRQKLDELEPGIKRFVNPQWYPVGIEKSLHELKMKLVLEARDLTN